MILATLVPAGVLATGLVAGLLLAGRHDRSGPVAILTGLAYAPALGFGTLSLLWFYSRFVHLPAPGPLVLLPLAAGVAAAAFVVLRRIAPRWRIGDAPGWGQRQILLAGWLGLTLVVLVAGGWRWAASRPYGVWDAVAIWTGRALMLARAEDPGEVLGRVTQAAHPDYPLLVPSSVAAQYGLAGSESLLIPQLTSVAFLLGLGPVVWLTVHRWRPGLLPVAAVLLLWSTPSVLVRGFTQCADVPLAYLFVAAVGGLASRLDTSLRHRVSPWLCGYFLGLLYWVKNEGQVLAVLAVGLFVFFALATRRLQQLRSDALPLLIAAAPGVLATVLLRRFWAPPIEELDKYFVGGFVERLTDPERWRTVAAFFLDHLSPAGQTQHWGWLWLALALAAILLWRRRRLVRHPPALYLGAVVLASFAAWFMVYVLTPYGVTWHLRTSLDRLLLQLVPCLVVFVFVAAELDRPAEE
ncbi:MAG: hypothetical protein GY719_31855 [bacterium]|nr:hypothetical protein [bacterium]